MFWRVFSFAAFQLAAGTIGWFFIGIENQLLHAAVAALCAGNLWFLLDLGRASRLLRWMRGANPDQPKLGGGAWAEVSDRVRKLNRANERAVMASEGKLQDFLAALQASPNGVVLLDGDGRIEWFNQTAAEHFGFDVRRDLQQHFGNLVRDPGFAQYIALQDYSHDVLMPGRNSSMAKPVRISVQMHPYGERRSLLLSRDVTAVEQAEAMRRDFVANVSHEIRTPLTVLSGFVETLQTLPLDEDERERYLGMMSQQAQRMQSLVNDLLMLSRLEGSPPPPSQEWIAVNTLLKQCRQDARDLANAIGGRSSEVDFLLAAAQTEIAGSPAELHSAMFNLIGNALRYTPSDQAIVVTWELREDGSALFSVKDNGPGIAPEHLSRLTERFYRVDRSRSRDTGGTGLGLAIVKHVSQRHGIELGIASKPGSGSTFTLLFPPGRIRQSENMV
jgi:two-component system phosphate regulon sensor histidine kinase PhoR